MVPVCVEEGYNADYWLGLIISAAHGFDCSSDEKLTLYIGDIVKELQGARKLQKQRTRLSFKNTLTLS